MAEAGCSDPLLPRHRCLGASGLLESCHTPCLFGRHHSCLLPGAHDSNISWTGLMPPG